MKILSFGSLNLDKVYAVEHFIRPGETMAALRMDEFCGGKGLNQSIALAKAGARVFHAGCVGKVDGEVLLTALMQAGIDVSLVRRLENVPTGHAIIQVDENGQNCILLYSGANGQVSREQIDDTLAKFEEGDFLVLQNEISELGYLIEAASRRKLTIVLNPSPMTEQLLELPLSLVDYFILNEVEAKDLCGSEKADEEYPALLQKRYPGSRVVLTLGEKGCIYQDETEQIFCPACRVKAVDTTAAGDTFTGYFVADVTAGEPVVQALKDASRAAAIAVSRRGAAPSIPTREEVNAFQPL